MLSRLEKFEERDPITGILSEPAVCRGERAVGSSRQISKSSNTQPGAIKEQAQQPLSTNLLVPYGAVKLPLHAVRTLTAVSTSLDLRCGIAESE